MKARFIPLFTQIGLLAWLAGIVLYLQDHLYARGIFTQLLIVGIPVMLSLISLVSIWQIPTGRKKKTLAIASTLIFLSGLTSFLIPQEPTTINLFGGILIFGGILLGLGSATLLAVSTRKV